MRIKDVKINYAEYDLPEDKKGKIAVLLYTGKGDPDKVLDLAVKQYVQNEGYTELMDANLNNPWMRVVISGVNEMRQEDFDPQKHKLLSDIRL